MNRWLFLFLLFWVAICVLCVYSIAYAEIVKEVRVEVKVEKVIKKEPIVYTNWTNPDKKGSCANLKSSHFGRMVFNKLEDHVDCQMVRGEY